MRDDDQAPKIAEFSRSRENGLHQGIAAFRRTHPLRAALLVLFAGILGVLAGTAPLVRPAAAQDELKIAAVVNDDVITQLDVFMRLRMAMLSAKLQDTPETRQRLLPTVMRALIDDHLKYQEAKTQGVTVGDAEVNNRIETLAKRNGMTRQDFETMLNGNGVLITALSDQIRSDIAWSRLVQRTLRSTIRITDAEIDEAMNRAKTARGKMEYHLSQIFLQVDSPKDSPQVQQSAQRLMEQLQSGAEFASLASEFSQDTTASNGGDMGWLRADEIDPAIARELLNAGSGADAKGKVLGPIAGTGGYFLVRIEDTRVGEESAVAPGSVHMVQLIWPLNRNPSDKEVQSAQDQADAYAGKVTSCDEFEREAPETAGFRDFGRVRFDDMPPEIRQMAMTQPIGTPTKGVRGTGGVAVFVICDRGGAGNSRVAIADRLAAERLETLARGYLSDLRRAAYIDIRL
ncbi:MAG TPA: peptidylprolyl isomerase [Candidatus Binatia bacterium]|nr:peptidylprolyl isomerase [Candidatus Binatia bacterium]